MSTVVSMLGGAEGRRLSPAFRSMAGRRLSPACRSMPSPLRRRQFELETMRELARCDEFSDSESDGVDSDEEDAEDAADDFDARETVYVPYRRPEAAQQRADRHAARRLHKMLAAMKKASKQQQQQADKAAGGSPKVRGDAILSRFRVRYHCGWLTRSWS
jgi:hypothetical protein